MLYYGAFDEIEAVDEKAPLFTVEFRLNVDQNLNFYEVRFEPIAHDYSCILIDGFSPYCLDDQIVKTVWEPKWGAPIIRTELECFGAVKSRRIEEGVVCDFTTYDENEEYPELQSSMFIPYNYGHAPAENYIGCEVDGTFFLIYNHVPAGLRSIG